MTKQILACIAALVSSTASFGAEANVKFETTYQAVLLDNGAVYFGKLQGIGTDFPLLTDVFYVQSQTNQETKDVKNILVRRGNEWHAPDRMYLNARHIVLVEPVSAASQVAKLIAQDKTH